MTTAAAAIIQRFGSRSGMDRPLGIQAIVYQEVVPGDDNWVTAWEGVSIAASTADASIQRTSGRRSAGCTTRRWSYAEASPICGASQNSIRAPFLIWRGWSPGEI